MHLNKEITLIHVMEIPITPFQVPLTELEFTEIETAVKEELEELRQKLLLQTKNKIKISKELKYGLIDQELEKFCVEIKPFAMVMGISSGEKSIRFFLGSNTLRMIHDASYPVLIIPEKAEFKPIKNITIASDLYEMYPAESLSFIREWLQTFTPHCDIVFVEPDQKSSEKFHTEIITLQKMFAEYNLKFHFIDSDNIHTGIINFIEEKKPDMLVILPENHSLLGSLFHTSVSRKLVLHTHLPILSVAAKQVENNSVINNSAEENKSNDCPVDNCSCKKEKENVAKQAVD